MDDKAYIQYIQAENEMLREKLVSMYGVLTRIYNHFFRVGYSYKRAVMKNDIEAAALIMDKGHVWQTEWSGNEDNRMQNQRTSHGETR